MSEFERRVYLCVWLCLFGSVVLSALPADAHHAPSGMAYDPGCCNSYDGHTGDCKPISDSDVQQNGDGSYTILASGERFLAPLPEGQDPNGGSTWDYSSGKAKHVNAHARWSKDESFHRCFHSIQDPSDGSYCLYVVPPGA